MSNLKVYADFQNADEQGRLRLNCVGTMQDLSRQKIALCEGLTLLLYSEDLEVAGRVHYSNNESLWVAVIDWDAIVDVSPENKIAVADESI